MKVVFVAPFGLKHKTTVWARTLPMAQSLVAMGHQATILIPPWDSPEDAGRIEMIGGVRLEQVSLAGGLLGTLHRLLKAIEAFAPDIVHIVKPRAHAGLMQWWLWYRRPIQAKIVLDVDDWEQAWNPINHYGWFVGNFLSWQEEWGIRHASGITTASRWLEAKIGTVAPQIPTLYLPNGVSLLTEPQEHLPTNKVQAPQILFFTRFVEVEAHWLHDFWEALQRQIPSAELLIAGSPVQPWLLEPFQMAMKSLAHVQWLGYVRKDELKSLYAGATCAIFPAMPIPLQQAKCSVRLATTLLHGVPVIASAVGEQANYGADGAARLVPAEATPSEFAQAVAQFVGEIAHAPAYIASQRREATDRMLERYNWSKLTVPLPAFYEAILRQR
jgi:glycosyltransferase involved in cell wall biosynthesis